ARLRPRSWRRTLSVPARTSCAPCARPCARCSRTMARRPRAASPTSNTWSRYATSRRATPRPCSLSTRWSMLSARLSAETPKRRREGSCRMRPSEALELHRDEVREIIARYPVGNPRVFGSAARGDDTEDSDLDILVDRTGPLTYFDIFDLEEELRSVLGCT